jgi:hypothetical protein
MSDLKISPKGKALLKNKYLASRVVNAIIKGGDQLTSGEGLTLDVNGKTLRLKAAPATTIPATTKPR